MSNEIRNKKIINGVIGVILFFVILFGGFWLIDEAYTIELKAQENEINLASPDLMGKEYLGNGVYELASMNGGTLTYNVYYGEFRLYGNLTGIFDYNFGYDRPYANNAYIQIWKTKQVVWENNGTIVGFGGGSGRQVVVNKNSDYNGIIPESANSMVIATYLVTGAIDVYFKLQLEQGTTATPYQVPIGALEQHIQIEKEKSYNAGVNNGYYLGQIKYNGVVGLTDNDYRGLLRTDKALGAGDDRYRDLWALLSHSHDYYYNAHSALYNFPFNVSLYVSTYAKHATLDLPAVNLLLISKEIKIDTMILSGETINFYRDSELQHSYNKNEIMEHFSTRGYSGTDSIYLRFVFDSGIENTPEYEAGYDQGYTDGYNKGDGEGYGAGYNMGFGVGYDIGYDEGFAINPNNNFGSMITTILLGVGTVLGIELLPNITIGAIIAVPIVFGIIAFVLGRKKE